ncbi:cytochrome c biogenesis protein/redoxin [Klebsiella pneumoniae]|nr:cytochrome c biogenesis protein/redoxin [Klebsiella pneumoniae]
MSILIAFLGGMLTLLSPCTLPVIPLLFASVRGRRGQLAIMLAGMALMFGAVSWLVTVASGWVVNLTLAGRGLALAFFALVGLSLLSQRVAQRLTSPLVALGNQLNDASSRQRGWIGSLLAGLAVGLLWAPCAGPVLGAILSLGFVHPGQATTGGLLLAYGSGGALMLFLLGWCGAALITRLRRGQAFGERLRRLAGGAMLASVALIASGGDRYLQSAGGLSQALEQRLAARLPQPEQKTSLQPIAAPQPSSAMPSEGIAFARTSQPLEEARQRLNLDAFLDTIVCDYADVGRPVQFCPEETAGVVWIPPQALRRVMTNLIDNALKFGTTATVTLTRDAVGDITLHVLDEGPGIPEASLQAVLQPFYRLEDSRNRDTGGTGLGLAIAAQLVSQMDGALRLANRPQGGLDASVRLAAAGLYPAVSPGKTDN